MVAHQSRWAPSPPFGERVGVTQLSRRSRLLLVVPAVVIEAELVVVEAIRTLIVRLVVIAAIVERAIAAAGGVVGGRRGASDIAEAGLAREFAATTPGR